MSGVRPLTMGGQRAAPRVPPISLSGRPDDSRRAHGGGASTERVRTASGIAGESLLSRDLREPRRAIAESKQWQLRCERAEAERDEARTELQAGQESMVQFLDKWQKREEYVQGLQRQISELQAQLANALTEETVARYDEFRPPSKRHARHTAPAQSHGGGRGTWSSRSTREARDPDAFSVYSTDSTGSGIKLAVPDVEKRDSKLLTMLRMQRQVARAKRASNYDNIEVPVLSLAPRVASVATFESHMSEKIAFQSGELLKEHIKSLQVAPSHPHTLTTWTRRYGRGHGADEAWGRGARCSTPTRSSSIRSICWCKSASPRSPGVGGCRVQGAGCRVQGAGCRVQAGWGVGGGG